MLWRGPDDAFRAIRFVRGLAFGVTGAAAVVASGAALARAGSETEEEAGLRPQATAGADAALGGAATSDAALVQPRSERAGSPLRMATPPEGFDSWPRLCSQKHPFCVRPSPGTQPEVADATLAAADRAWDALTGALFAPPPEGWLGDPWAVYLVPQVEGETQVQLQALNPLSRYDQGASFALVDRSLSPGCELDLAVARAVARGSIWRAAPAIDEGTAQAHAEMLARLAGPSCDAPEADGAAFQAEPERCLADSRSRAFSRGASAFFDWVDATFGARPGALLTGLWALAATVTPAGAARWAPSPTPFDVLSASLRGALGRESTFDDVLVRFAVMRASMTPPVHLAWRVPWPERARRLAAPQPIAPTGASYVLVEHTGVPAGAKLRLELEWEDYGRMRWVVLKCGAAGRILGEIPITSLDRGTRASMTLEDLDGLDYVLVVGVNVGSTDHGFNPAQGEWEPHGWLLTIEGQ